VPDCPGGRIFVCCRTFRGPWQSVRITLLFLLLFIVGLSACNGEIYLRDGVTDGDTFYLADRALADDDAVLQSWVSYSLARSTCQLQIGGPNPARSSSFDCELTARRLLLETWNEHKMMNPPLVDSYLDELAQVQDAGYLDEYVAHHFSKNHWQLPDDLGIAEYSSWQRLHLDLHKVETRIVGSWNYASNVLSK